MLSFACSPSLSFLPRSKEVLMKLTGLNRLWMWMWVCDCWSWLYLTSCPLTAKIGFRKWIDGRFGSVLTFLHFIYLNIVKKTVIFNSVKSWSGLQAECNRKTNMFHDWCAGLYEHKLHLVDKCVTLCGWLVHSLGHFTWWWASWERKPAQKLKVYIFNNCSLFFE